MKKSIILSSLVALFITCILSCKKENNDDVIVNPSGTTGRTINTTVSGMVMDESNDPVVGVAVSAGGKTTTTDQFGIFVLKNINPDKNRCIIYFRKDGFFNRQHCIVATANSVNYVRVVLLSNITAFTVSGLAGGAVTLSGGSNVVFQPSSFVSANGAAYTGSVSLAVKHLSPANANFGFTIPGGDLKGVNAGNTEVALYSYGMLGVELKGSGGENLQLASGKPATLTFPIASSQLATAPASIPLWYFDEVKALWKEEGLATKIGNTYVGTVNHFSWWNCDHPEDMATVKGKVVDCGGAPIPNVMVSIKANNGYTTYALTDQNGGYSFLMAVNFNASVQFLASMNPPFSQNSQMENITMLTMGQTLNVPSLVVQCPTRIAGTAQKCNGLNTEALILLRINNALVSYQYTSTGAFSVIAPNNSNFRLEATDSESSATIVATSLTAPDILNVGNMLMCDDVSLSDNSFTLNSTILPSQLYNILVAYSSAYVGDSSQNIFTYTYASGYVANDIYIINCNIVANDTVPGNTTCAVSVELKVGQNEHCTITGQNIPCHITQVGAVGGKIKGTYGGTVITSDDLNSATESITGAFSITRTQ